MLISQRLLPLSLDFKKALWVYGDTNTYIKSWIGLPLIMRGQVIGALTLDNETSHHYNEEHLNIGQILAAELALAIQNSRLFEQTVRHAAELEQKVTERTEKLQLSNAELEAFAYSVSHDLRSPLRAMEGFANALQEDHHDNLGETGLDYIKSIISAARHMDTLILDLLAYSRLSGIEIYQQEVDLERLWQMIVDQYAQQIEAAQAEVKIDRPLHNMIGHYAILNQVADNLFTNALKFTSPGTSPNIRIWTEKGHDHIRLNIQDNGIGIAAENQSRIFQVFRRLHGPESYPGTGIGLALVAKGMERMGGRYGVQSDPGQGSCFWIELPAALTPPP